MRIAEFTSALGATAKAHTMNRRDVLLVQIKDEDGFWCNVLEIYDVQEALAFAEQYAVQHNRTAQVVKGSRRQLVRQFQVGR